MIVYIDNGSSISAVNFPQVALPAHDNTHRLLHGYRNTPGIIRAINQIFSEFNINVAAQYLQTNDRVGYVVVDIEAEYSPGALAALNGIVGAIR